MFVSSKAYQGCLLAQVGFLAGIPARGPTPKERVSPVCMYLSTCFLDKALLSSDTVKTRNLVMDSSMISDLMSRVDLLMVS